MKKPTVPPKSTRRQAKIQLHRKQTTVRTQSGLHARRRKPSSTYQSAMGSNMHSRTEQTKARAVAKKQNARSYSNTGRVLSGIIFVFVLLYLAGYAIHFLNREKVPFETVEMGHIAVSKSIEGIVVRDETVYKQTKEGAVYYNVSDKERVRKGMALCNVRNEAVVSEIENNLDQINKEIFDKQKSRDQLSIFAEDVKRVNGEVNQMVGQNIQNLAVRNMAEMYNFVEQVQKKVDTRNQMLLTEGRGTVAQLVGEKETIQNKLSQSLEKIVAAESGIISFDLDGYEDTLQAKSVDSITPDALKIKTNKVYETQKGELFKVVTSNDWYIVCMVPTDSVTNLVEGSRQKIYIDDYENQTLDVSIYKIVPEDKQSMLILKSKREIMDFVAKRAIRFELDKPTEGYKIPNGAIVEQTLILIPSAYISNDVVYKVENGVQTEVQINEAERDEQGNVYVSLSLGMLTLGDVLKNPTAADQTYKLEQVKTTVGVFIVNSGIADFKAVNTTNMVQNDTHTVLDPALNPNLMVYDRIISDAKKIENGQIVMY